MSVVRSDARVAAARVMIGTALADHIDDPAIRVGLAQLIEHYGAVCERRGSVAAWHQAMDSFEKIQQRNGKAHL